MGYYWATRLLLEYWAITGILGYYWNTELLLDYWATGLLMAYSWAITKILGLNIFLAPTGAKGEGILTVKQ